jgi:hypothetical protein
MDPRFLKQIQEAVDRGQTVVISAPAIAPPQRDVDATRIAALSLAFGLGRGEARILAYLLTYGFASASELCAQRGVTAGSLRVFITLLRRKLKPCGAVIRTLPRQGYDLDRKSRAKILRTLAKHGADTSALEQSLTPAAGAPP